VVAFNRNDWSSSTETAGRHQPVCAGVPARSVLCTKLQELSHHHCVNEPNRCPLLDAGYEPDVVSNPMRHDESAEDRGAGRSDPFALYQHSFSIRSSAADSANNATAIELPNTSWIQTLLREIQIYSDHTKIAAVSQP
jgi:hypothetical protein